MMLKWQWQIISRAGSIGLAAYIAWHLWDYLGPQKPEVGPVRKQVAGRLIPTVVEDLRTSRQTVRSAVLLHLENDPSDYMTDHLRSRIEQSGILDLRDRTLAEKIRNGLRLRHPSYGDPESALSQSSHLGVQGVIFGSVHTFESYPGGAKIDLEISLADVSNQTIVFGRRYTKEHSVGVLSGANVAEKVMGLHSGKRFVAWIVAVLLLPVFTISFIRSMVRRESNRANAFTLLTYTIVDGLLAYLLLGASLGSWVSIVLFLVSVGLAFGYNLFLIGLAVRLEN